MSATDEQKVSEHLATIKRVLESLPKGSTERRAFITRIYQELGWLNPKEHLEEHTVLVMRTLDL